MQVNVQKLSGAEWQGFPYDDRYAGHITVCFLEFSIHVTGLDNPVIFIFC